MKLPREFYIPAGAVKIADKQSDAVAYLYPTPKGPACRIFFGKQGKPVVACYYRDQAARERAIRATFENRRQRLGRVAERRAERTAWVPTYKVGDIFRTCWGYDQTNVEYFELVEIKGKHGIFRELDQERVDTNFMQGKCVPLPGQYAKGDEPIRRLLQQRGIRIDDVRTAWKCEPKMVGGVPVIAESSWSAYH